MRAWDIIDSPIPAGSTHISLCVSCLRALVPGIRKQKHSQEARSHQMPQRHMALSSRLQMLAGIATSAFSGRL